MKYDEIRIAKWRKRLALRAHIKAQTTAFGRLRAHMSFHLKTPCQRWRPGRIVINTNPRRTIERFNVRRFVKVTGIHQLPVNLVNVINRNTLAR